MSGGHFNYSQYEITTIAETIESIIRQEQDPNYDGWKYLFDKKTLNEFRVAVNTLKVAAVYAQRIDWLLSGDDGEETFHKRLKEDLEKL